MCAPAARPAQASSRTLSSGAAAIRDSSAASQLLLWRLPLPAWPPQAAMPNKAWRQQSQGFLLVARIYTMSMLHLGVEVRYAAGLVTAGCLWSVFAPLRSCAPAAAHVWVATSMNIAGKGVMLLMADEL